MADKKIAPVKKVVKKNINKEIHEKLVTALAAYKALLGEKKFESKVKKASKIFTAGLTKASKKTKTVTRKKKAAKKK